MDKQTQIGLGGLGVGILVGLGQPYLPWSITAPSMVLAAGLAVWGLWPLVGSLGLGQLSIWRVPLRTAARMCFEAVEGSAVGHFVALEFTNETDRLSYFVSSLTAHEVPIFGRQPPSRVAREVPQPAKANLALVEGTNDLHRITGCQQVEYRDVYVRRPDLWRHIRYLRQARPETV